MNLRKFYRTSSETREKLTLQELEKNTFTLCRLFGNLLRRSELNILNTSYNDTFHPGLLNNYIYIKYIDINLEFNVSVTGKVKIKIKRKKLVTNIIYDKNISEKIKKFVHDNISKI